MPYNASMFSFIETRLFTKLVLEYLTDAQYAELQQSLMRDPEAGPVIPAPAGYASCDGEPRAAASAAATA